MLSSVHSMITWRWKTDECSEVRSLNGTQFAGSVYDFSYREVFTKAVPPPQRFRLQQADVRRSHWDPQCKPQTHCQRWSWLWRWVDKWAKNTISKCTLRKNSILTYSIIKTNKKYGTNTPLPGGAARVVVLARAGSIMQAAEPSHSYPMSHVGRIEGKAHVAWRGHDVQDDSPEGWKRVNL